MNLSHLRYFFDTISTKSLSKAAEMNSVSQSAVSLAIRSLEGHFGCDLILHQRNRVELTDAGKEAYDRCVTVFLALSELEAGVMKQGDAYYGELTIGCTNSVLTHFLSSRIVALNDLEPGIKLRLRLGNSDSIRQWLLDREIELGVFVEDLDSGDTRFESDLLLEGNYKLFANELYHRNLHENKLLVTDSKHPEIIELCRSYQSAHKHNLKPALEIASWDAIKKLVAMAPRWMGFAPDYVLRDEMASKAIKILKPGFHLPTYKLKIFRLKNRPSGKNAQLVIDQWAPH